VDFVENDQFVFVLSEKKGRFAEFLPVSWIFKIKIQTGPLLLDYEGKGRLAHLPGTDKRNCGLSHQGGFNERKNASINHPCNLSNQWMICKFLALNSWRPLTSEELIVSRVGKSIPIPCVRGSGIKKSTEENSKVGVVV
jgi:hypothetical protein